MDSVFPYEVGIYLVSLRQREFAWIIRAYR